MKLALILPFLMIGMIPAFAQTDDGGTQPDSPLWGIDVALDKLRLLLAQDETERARIGLEIAEERLLEISTMISRDRLVDAEKAQREHDETVTGVERAIARTPDVARTQGLAVAQVEILVADELQDTLEITERFEMHKLRIENVKEKIKVRLNSIPDPTRFQVLERLDRNLDDSVQRVDVRLVNEKERIELRFTNDFDKSSVDVRSIVTNAESTAKIRSGQ